MLIYPDTVLWNELCDQGVDADELVSTLAGQSAQLVLGTEAVYEMAKTFQMRRPEAEQRGMGLFSYLGRFVQERIPCLRITSDILRAEMKRASRETKTIDIFLNDEDYMGLTEEVGKLSRGTFDSRADRFIAERKVQAAGVRQEIAGHFGTRPKLNQIIAAVPVEGLGEWIQEELRKSGRRLLRWHLNREFPEASPKQITWLAKRLLASRAYRVSHAIVRSDLYLNWRYAQVQSISRDVPDDLYHIVNASYCDLYVTRDKEQGKYAPFVLGKTAVAVYDGDTRLSEWLSALAARA